MAASTSYSDVATEATFWTNPDPDHGTLLGTVGAGVGTNRGDVARAIVNVATQSPTLLAFVLAGDHDHVHVGYCPTLFPQDITAPTPCDNHVVVLVGNDLSTAVPVVMSYDAFARTANIRCKRVADIVGAQGHGAAPPVFQDGPHGVGVADTDNLQLRPAFLMPANRAGDLLTLQDSGRYSVLGFYNAFVAPGLADADADVQNAHHPIRDWFRGISTLNVNGGCCIEVTAVTSAAPRFAQRLTSWSSRIRNAELTKLGTGGPALTTAAFQAGITNVTTTLNDTTREQLRFQRERDSKTFTQKHGSALAQRMHH